MASRADQRALRWFGHVERIDEHRMARRVLMAEVSGGLVRGRLRLGQIDGMKVALGDRGMRWRLHNNVREIGRSEKSWCICR